MGLRFRLSSSKGALNYWLSSTWLHEDIPNCSNLFQNFVVNSNFCEPPCTTKNLLQFSFLQVLFLCYINSVFFIIL